MAEAVSIVYSVYTHLIPYKYVTYLTGLKDLSLNIRTDKSDILLTDKPVVSTHATPQDNQDNRPTCPHADKKSGHEPQQ